MIMPFNASLWLSICHEYEQVTRFGPVAFEAKAWAFLNDDIF